MQPVDCKPLTIVKREFLEISRRTTFSYIIMHMMELCKMQKYCYFSKKCSSMTFKNPSSQHSQETFSQVSVFSIAIGSRLDRTNYVKRTYVKQLERLKSISTEEFLLGMFQNFQKRSFSEHSLKKYNVGNFLET